MNPNRNAHPPPTLASGQPLRESPGDVASKYANNSKTTGMLLEYLDHLTPRKIPRACKDSAL